MTEDRAIEWLQKNPDQLKPVLALAAEIYARLVVMRGYTESGEFYSTCSTHAMHAACVFIALSRGAE